MRYADFISNSPKTRTLGNSELSTDLKLSKRRELNILHLQDRGPDQLLIEKVCITILIQSKVTETRKHAHLCFKGFLLFKGRERSIKEILSIFPC